MLNEPPGNLRWNSCRDLTTRGGLGITQPPPATPPRPKLRAFRPAGSLPTALMARSSSVARILLLRSVKVNRPIPRIDQIRLNLRTCSDQAAHNRRPGHRT